MKNNFVEFRCIWNSDINQSSIEPGEKYSSSGTLQVCTTHIYMLDANVLRKNGIIIFSGLDAL